MCQHARTWRSLSRAGLVACSLALPHPARSQDAAPADSGSVPAALDVRRLRISVVAERYLTEVQGVNVSFEEPEPDAYRSLVLTLRVDKPAGTPIELRANDLVLHYRRGEAGRAYDVTPALGVSMFSTRADALRPMVLEPQGRCFARSAPQATSASVVYVDVFFPSLEPDTRELYLLVAQPAGVFFRSRGWGTARELAAASKRDCATAR